MLAGRMQQHESAATGDCHDPTRGEAGQDAAAKPTRLAPAIPLREELIMQKRDDLVVADLLDAKMGSQAFLQEAQRRPFQPGDKIERR